MRSREDKEELKTGCSRSFLPRFIVLVADVVVIVGISVYRFSRCGMHPLVPLAPVAAVLTAPFIRPMQIECDPELAPSFARRDERVEWTRGRNNAAHDRHSGPITRVHTVDLGFVACPGVGREKKSFTRISRDTRGFFMWASKGDVSAL